VACGGRSELEAIVPCFAPVADCNRYAFDGCEVNLTSDRDHCGACGQRCPEGTACGDSRCVAPETPVQVETNGGAALVRTAGGAVFGWGDNWAGTLLNRPELVTTTVSLTELVPFAEIRLSIGNGCGRTFDGAIWCWGLGDVPGRDDTLAPAPARVPGIDHAVRLTSLSWGHCALEALGDWKCWGPGYRDEVAIGAGEPVAEPLAEPVTIRALPGFGRDVLPGLAVLADGSVWAWGNPNTAGLYVTAMDGPVLPTVDSPIRLPFVTDAAGVHGWLHVFCARSATTAAVVCWGFGSRPWAAQDPQVPFEAFPPDEYKEIAPSHYHLCGLRRDGQFLCAAPDTAQRERSDVADIASHHSEIVLVTRDGRVFCLHVDAQGNCATGELGFVYDYVEVAPPHP
jgi:hypothetical protein